MSLFVIWVIIVMDILCDRTAAENKRGSHRLPLELVSFARLDLGGGILFDIIVVTRDRS